jgi:hypothetical protein
VPDPIPIIPIERRIRLKRILKNDDCARTLGWTQGRTLGRRTTGLTALGRALRVALGRTFTGMLGRNVTWACGWVASRTTDFFAVKRIGFKAGA